MSQIKSQRIARRGRIFPERTIYPEERAKRQAEIEAFHQRCRSIFERIRPELIEEHYNWFIAIEPESEDYFIDRDRWVVLQKALSKYPQGLFGSFRINETGVCGRI